MSASTRLQHATLRVEALPDHRQGHLPLDAVHAWRGHVAVPRLKVDDSPSHDPDAAAEHRLAEVSDAESVRGHHLVARLVQERDADVPLAVILDLFVRGRPQLLVGSSTSSLE
eukprot:8215298-Pyramimonas_sp.AAC.1